MPSEFNNTYGNHQVEFYEMGFNHFWGANCTTCKKSLSCGFPLPFIMHGAEHHAGLCDCPGPDLTTWR